MSTCTTLRQSSSTTQLTQYSFGTYSVDLCSISLTERRCRHYIAGARQKRPTVPPEVSNYIVESYVRLRKQSEAAEKEDKKKSHSYTSPRTLLGVLRLSQALARLRYSDAVEHGDVDEALRLMEVSKESLVDEDEKERDADGSDLSRIYRIIKDELVKRTAAKPTRSKRRGAKRFGKGPDGERDMDVDDDDYVDEEESVEEVSLTDLRSRVIGGGFTEAAFMETILQVSAHYFGLPYVVLMLVSSSTRKWTSGSGSPTAPSSVLFSKRLRTLYSSYAHLGSPALHCLWYYLCSVIPFLQYKYTMIDTPKQLQLDYKRYHECAACSCDACSQSPLPLPDPLAGLDDRSRSFSLGSGSSL